MVSALEGFHCIFYVFMCTKAKHLPPISNPDYTTGHDSTHGVTTDSCSLLLFDDIHSHQILIVRQGLIQKFHEGVATTM